MKIKMKSSVLNSIEPSKYYETRKLYNEKNKEKYKEYKKKYYEINKEKIRRKAINYDRVHRMKVLYKIDPLLKCKRCGCDDLRFLEINHINGGGWRESKSYRYTSSTSISHAIRYFGRKTDDLELLCRPCNHIHFLERKYKINNTNLKVIWEKPKENYN